MKIRNAKKEDAEELIKLSLGVFGKYDKKYPADKLDKKYWGSRKHINSLQKEMTGRKYQYLVAEDEGKIIGWISIFIEKNFDIFKIKKRGHFDLLVIDPKYQKKGVGKKLVDEAMRCFRKNKIKNFTVNTHALDKGANAFWRKMGFKPHNLKLIR